MRGEAAFFLASVVTPIWRCALCLVPPPLFSFRIVLWAGVMMDAYVYGALRMGDQWELLSRNKMMRSGKNLIGSLLQIWRSMKDRCVMTVSVSVKLLDLLCFSWLSFHGIAMKTLLPEPRLASLELVCWKATCHRHKDHYYIIFDSMEILSYNMFLLLLFLTHCSPVFNCPLFSVFWCSKQIRPYCEDTRRVRSSLWLP